MTSWNLRTAFRDFKRLKEITGVLFSEGLGYYVHELKLKHHLFLSNKDRSKKVEKPENIPENLRKAMDRLGPTFVKLGQLLSLRPDLIPEEYCKEFSKLQDNVTGIEYSTVKKIVETELKLKLNEIFSFFDKEPIASASIGQVHKAKLLNGKVVVVKVQRPNIKPIIESDIDILYYLADLAKRHIIALRNHDLNGIIKEFERYTEKELDYLQEGRNIDKFYTNFQDDKTVVVPKVFWDFTTSRVLTMSYVRGIPIDEKEKLREEDCDMKIISSNLADCFLRQVFDFSFFHADPHPANIFVCPRNKIGLLDYGIVGKLSEKHKEQLTNILIKLVQRDLEGVLNGFLELGIIEGENIEGLKEELSAIIEEYAGASIEQVNVPRLFSEFLKIASRYHFKVPKDFVLLGKAIITIEGVGQEIDPDFNLSHKLAEYSEGIKLERIGIGYFVKNLSKSIINYKEMFTKFPKQTTEILERLRQGDLKVQFQHKDLNILEEEIDRGSNRVALAVLIGALVVASSLILNITGSKFFAVAGFVIALILSLFLSISIYKERNIRV